jgi:rhodanese-related sulfurtransferase
MKTETLSDGELETWTPAEVGAAMERGEIVLIDVRTPPEYAFEHVGGALLQPLHDLTPKALPVGGDRQVVFHCGSGVRSRKAAETCLAAGWKRAAHMEGGFGGWKSAGLPYLGTDPATGGPRKAGG